MSVTFPLALLAALALAADPVAVGPRPDPLADLMAALGRLTARTPASARFTVRFENTTGEGKEAVRVAGEVAGEVSEGAAGLEVHWGQAVLAKARGEERRHAINPEETTPTRDGLAQVQAIDLANRLDAAASLRDELSRATLLEVKEDQHDGAPARLLVLKLSPVLSARERRYLKDLDAVGRVWLGADGLPLAAEARVLAKGRIFLIITFETEIRQSWRFTRIGDRLVSLRHEDERRWEGAGEAGGRKSAVSLELLPAIAPAAALAPPSAAAP
jgi:hypothetical protein